MERTNKLPQTPFRGFPFPFFAMATFAAALLDTVLSSSSRRAPGTLLSPLLVRIYRTFSLSFALAAQSPSVCHMTPLCPPLRPVPYPPSTSPTAPPRSVSQQKILLRPRLLPLMHFLPHIAWNRFSNLDPPLTHNFVFFFSFLSLIDLDSLQ